MTSLLSLQEVGRAGRITLTRPDALNALTLEMIGKMRDALTRWIDDPRIDLIVIDAMGDRAFCAGGDLAALYGACRSGDPASGRQFWAEEYRLNLDIATCPKPVVSMMHGFVMGGGIGLGCHAALRIVDPGSVLAVSQVRIGLAPDAGASFLLSLTPGRMGEYLGATGRRFGAADAVWLGFADRIIPRHQWSGLVASLCRNGSLEDLPEGMKEDAPLAGLLSTVNASFGGESLGDIWRALMQDDSPFAIEARAQLAGVSPLAAAAAVEMMHRLGDSTPMARALELEYRFSHRAMTQGDVLEGIRALLIDRDQAPNWRHSGPEAVPSVDVAQMLFPLGSEAWTTE